MAAPLATISACCPRVVDQCPFEAKVSTIGDMGCPSLMVLEER